MLSNAHTLGFHRKPLPKEWIKVPALLGAWHVGYYSATKRPTIPTCTSAPVLSRPTDPTEGYRWGLSFAD